MINPALLTFSTGILLEEIVLGDTSALNAMLPWKGCAIERIQSRLHEQGCMCEGVWMRLIVLGCTRSG